MKIKNKSINRTSKKITILKDGFVNISNAVGPAKDSILADVSKAGKAFNTMKPTLNEMKNTVVTCSKDVIANVKTVAESISNTASVVVDSVKNNSKIISDSITKGFEGVKNAISEGIDGIKGQTENNGLAFNGVNALA